MTYYYTEQKASGMNVVVSVSDDGNETKVAAVPVTIKWGPFHKFTDLELHLTERVRERGGNGTLFHVYNEAGT